jgi:hypothetical protein
MYCSLEPPESFLLLPDSVQETPDFQRFANPTASTPMPSTMADRIVSFQSPLSERNECRRKETISAFRAAPGSLAVRGEDRERFRYLNTDQFFFRSGPCQTGNVDDIISDELVDVYI